MTINPRRQRRWLATVVPMALVISACGNDNSDAGDALVEETAAVDSGGTESNNSGGGSSAGTIDDAPPSGQAAASVDGQEFTFELPGGLACSISDDALTYSYRIGDNEVTLGAGVNRVDGGWMGNVSLQVANPVGEQGPIAYYPAPGEAGVLDESLFTVDGDTAVYVGPMLKQPANDGTQPPPVDVGSGRVIATC